MEEIWKDIVGLESRFQVSSMGNVKRLSHHYVHKKWGTRFLGEMKSKLVKTKFGYLMVSVMKSRLVHRLVAIAFIPNPDNKPHVNHINGVKHDNRVENLEWCTRSENMRHAYNMKLKISRPGSKHPLAKISESDAVEMRLKFKKGVSIVSLAKEYSLKYITVYMIISRRAWKHC